MDNSEATLVQHGKTRYNAIIHGSITMDRQSHAPRSLKGVTIDGWIAMDSQKQPPLFNTANRDTENDHPRIDHYRYAEQLPSFSPAKLGLDSTHSLIDEWIG